MNLPQYLAVLGLLVFSSLSGCSVTEAPNTDTSIRHFDIQNGAAEPKQFNKIRSEYISDSGSPNKFELRYYPIDDIVEFEDGWLVTGSKGEWGGILYWLGRDGDLEILVKNSDNPSDLALLKDAVLVTWSPFLPLTGGHSDLLRIRMTNGNPSVEKFKVPGAVTGFERRNGNLWINASTRHANGSQTASHRIETILSAQ